MSRALRIVGWSVVAVLALSVAALGGLRLFGMPQVDGEVRTGVHADVRIVRDARGVPHVFAQDQRDAWFAIGFLHAQDRLWQMEMNRRVAAGRLSEVLGAGALDTDRFLRTIGVRRNAQRIAARLDAGTRADLQSYADGVNAGIGIARSQPWKLSPEFLLLGVRPEPWTIEDSIGWMTMMAWDLSANHSTELLRLALSDRLSSKQLSQLLDLEPDVPLPDLRAMYRGLDLAPVAQLLRTLPPGGIDGVGSNDWVVDGRHSTSGKPLLANDPHLALGAPALWYLAHLSAPGLDVVGATLPGIPAVVLGRNRRIAWGFTNTAPDTQDLFLERVDPADPGRYLTPRGWEPFTVRDEVIRVKGAPDVHLKVRETRHGPVISGVFGQAGRALHSRALDGRYVLAFEWTALSPDDASVRAGFGVNRARDWNEFVAALRDWGSPEQNMVFADVDGDIGFIAPARVPVRKPENDLHGLAPAPGWDARYDWNGFIPFDALPREFRPADGEIVTANNRIVGDDYPYFLTAEWVPPYRHDRIVERLTAVSRHDPASFASIQADVRSGFVAQLLPVLRRAHPTSELARAALARLSTWQGDMKADSTAALIADAWLDRLRRLVFADEVGPDLYPLFDQQRGRTRALALVLTRPERAAWCDDVTTAAVETCGQMVDRALEQAVADLKGRFGGDLSSWRWGDAHVAVSEHRPFSRVAALAPFFDVRVPSPGDAYTVDVGRNSTWDPKEPFASHHAPSLRAIYDLSDADASRFMFSTGQSGHVLSPHYRDLAERWVRVEYLTVPMSREKVEREAADTLTLKPAR